jgi:hypothetical protein
MYCEGRHDFPAEDHLELRTLFEPERVYLHRPGTNTVKGGLSAPNTYRWQPALELERSWRDDGPTDTVNLVQTLRPIPPLSCELAATYQRASGEMAYFDTVGDTPVAGLRRLSQFDLVARASYAFSPRSTLEIYSQWMDSAWSFRDLHRYGPSGRLGPHQPTEPTVASRRLWNLNLLARWEFRPGSTAHLVYTHGVQSETLLDDGAALHPYRDLVALGHMPSDDVVQLKVSWLLR